MGMNDIVVDDVSAPQAPQSGIGDATLTGDPYLQTLAPNLQPVVKSIAEGRSPYPQGFLMKTPFGQALTVAANRYDPTFDASNYPARVAQRKNYEGGGKQYQELQAIGTVAGHLQDLKTVADKMNNISGLGPLNAPVNKIVQAYRETSQDPRIAEFNTVKNAVTRELTKAYQGGHITDSSVAEWQQSLNAAQTPEQLKTVIGKLNDLLMSKRITLEEGYKQTMGKSQLPANFSSVNDRTRKIFEGISEWSHGAQAQAAQPGQPAAPAQPGAPQQQAPQMPVPPPEQRQPGQTYPTPRGPMTWSGTGWVPAAVQ